MGRCQFCGWPFISMVFLHHTETLEYPGQSVREQPTPLFIRTVMKTAKDLIRRLSDEQMNC